MSATDVKTKREPLGGPRRGSRRGLRAFRRDQDGVAAVEFAMVAVPFFGILFAILETAIGFWSMQVLETAVGNASRTLYTGQFQNPPANDPVPPDGAKFKQEVCKHVTALFNCHAESVRVDVRRFTPGTPPPDVINRETKEVNPAAFGYEATRARDIVLVRVAVEYPVFVNMWGLNQGGLANGKRLIMGSATFRNEPF